MATDREAQRLLYRGRRQQRARRIVVEAARAARIVLARYVDDVVFTTGRVSWFAIIDDRRVIAISGNVLRQTRAGRLITAVHELAHARHAALLGQERYRELYALDRGRIEILVESRALRTVERYLGRLSARQRALSLRYIRRWLSVM